MKASVLGLATELNSFTSDPYKADLDFYRSMTPSDTEEALHRLFRDASNLAEHPGRTSADASFELTHQMLALGSLPNAISSKGASVHGSCFQSELRLVRDVGRQETKQVSATRLPAAVLLDVEANPFAFQKSDGYPTAYAWRTASFATKTSAVTIPKGAIFELRYDGESTRGVYSQDPRHNFRGAGLITLPDSPVSAHLKRLSLESMPDELREVALSFATSDVVSLERYKARAHRLNAESLGQQIVSLLS